MIVGENARATTISKLIEAVPALKMHVSGIIPTGDKNIRENVLENNVKIVVFTELSPGGLCVPRGTKINFKVSAGNGKAKQVRSDKDIFNDIE